MDLLSGSESDSADKSGNAFKINKKYAKHYEKWRRQEEKQKLIDKYGNDALDSDSESEDEIRSTQKLDKEWLRAYAVVRFQQARLYSGEKLFKEEVKPVPKKVEKKTTLKDHERKFVLEKGGVASEDEDDDEAKRAAGPGYYEEQEEIKSSLKQAIGNLDQDDDDSLFMKKTKTDKEQEEEDNDYLAWLKGEKEELEDKQASEELAPLKEYWSNPNLTEKEKVLRDYILNNGYMDKEGSDDDDNDDSDDGSELSFEEEEEFLDEAEKYEKTYNFRHEEPGGIEIKTYPRYIETSVRAKEENKRVEKRKRKAEKKQREKEQRMEEIKVLQRLQREEKEQKLQKLKDLAENQDLEYDLDKDFDPEEHDKIMKKYFNESYYHEEESGEKPVFEDDVEMQEENYEDKADSWWQEREQNQKEEEEFEGGEEELYADDPGFIMDADYDPSAVEAEKQSKKEAKKSKKEQKKAKKNKKLQKAPLFDPTTKTFDEYLDEYLTDKINSLPFTYRQVMPNNFGLSTEEILSVPDRELNSWVSVKKMSMYRSTEEEKNDIHKYKVKADNVYKKHKTLPSLAPQQESETRDIPALKKKKKKKKDKKSVEKNSIDDKHNDTESTSNHPAEDKEADTPEDGGEKKKKKKKRKAEESEEESQPKIKKQKTKGLESDSEDKKKSSSLSTAVENGEGSDVDDEIKSTPRKKDKKKKKQKLKDENNGPETIKEGNTESPLMGEKRSSKTEVDSESRLVGKDEVQNENKVKKNKKKKNSKLKIATEDDVTEEHRPEVGDKIKTKKKLKKLMSASRLSSYGIGPGAHKHGNKLNKKKKKPNNTPA